MKWISKWTICCSISITFNSEVNGKLAKDNSVDKSFAFDRSEPTHSVTPYRCGADLVQTLHIFLRFRVVSFTFSNHFCPFWPLTPDMNKTFSSHNCHCEVIVPYLSVAFQPGAPPEGLVWSAVEVSRHHHPHSPQPCTSERDKAHVVDKTQQTRGLHGSESSFGLSVRQQVGADTMQRREKHWHGGWRLFRKMHEGGGGFSLKAAPTKTS